MSSKADVRQLFKKHAEDGKFLTKAEFKKFMASLGIPKKQVDETHKAIFNDLDSDKDGKLSVDEFKKFIEDTEGQEKKKSKKDKRDSYKTIFNLCDIDNDGFVTEAELKIFLGRLTSNQISPKMVAQIVKEADENNDGKISFDEFCKYCEDNDILELGLKGVKAKAKPAEDDKKVDK